jgi:Lamin Tail Domain/FG-GAP-like repeat
MRANTHTHTTRRALRASVAALLAAGAYSTGATPALAAPLSVNSLSGPLCPTSGCAPPLGITPTTAAIVDVDGDGKNEIVYNTAPSGAAGSVPSIKVSTLLGGTEAPNATYAAASTAGGPMPSWIRAEDLDSDGDQDLLIIAGGNILRYMNNGAGVFSASTTITAAASVATLDLGDVDGDGDLDIVIGRTATASTMALSVVPGQGDGTFGSEIAISTAVIAKASMLKLADFDGDGDLDIASVRYTTSSADYAPPRVIVTLNSGDGTFAAPTSYDGTPRLTNLFTSRVLATGDFDGDGDIDLAFNGGTTTNAGSVSVLKNSGDGTFGARTDYPLTGLTTLLGLLAGDVDGDGDQDLVTLGGASKLGYLLGQGSGSFDAHVVNADFSSSISAFSASQGVQADGGDIDGDGAWDVAVPLRSGSIFLGTFQGSPAITGVGKALIREVRLSGPNGRGDQYVDIYNRSLSSPLNLGGWKLKASSGATVKIQQGTMVPAGGHLLLTGPRNAALGWSLGAIGRSALQLPFGNAAGNLAADAASGGIALIGPSGQTVDAVGFGSVASAYREGAALAPVTAIGQLAFVRRSADGAPVDTGENAADFVAVDTAADGTTAAQLGAPRPDNSTAPTVKNDFLQSTLVDASKTAAQSPNRVLAPGQLTINRTIVNCSGSAKTDPATSAACVNAATTSGKTITKLRFRITDLTTVGTPGTGKAVLKAVASSDATTDGIAVKGLPLDAPSASTGGGLNSTLTATSLLPAGGLAPGQSINVAFTFTIVKSGKFAFGYNTEDDLIETTNTTPEATPTPAPTPHAATPANPVNPANPANPEAAEPAVPVADTTQGTIPQSAVANTPASASQAASTKAPANAKAKANAKTNKAKAKAAAKRKAKARAKCRTLTTKQRRNACLTKTNHTTRH